MASGYRSVAIIQKMHGRNGEVVAVPADGLPFVLREGLRVALVPPALKGPRWREVLRCAGSGTGQLVSLGGVVTLDEASKLVGKHVLVSEVDLPADFAAHDATTLVGRRVVDGRLGGIGAIEEVMMGPANDVWVVRGPFGEVLVPVVDAVVREVPPSGDVCVDLPDGLVEDGGAL